MFSSIMLQIVAMICMLIDHVGLYLCDNFWPMRLIGRIAMPLFVFGLVEGFLHTSSRIKYFVRIAVTAMITQFVLLLLEVQSGIVGSSNILFNFMITFMALLCLEKGGFAVAMVPILAIMSEVLNFDYGWAIVVMASGFYYVLKHTKFGKPEYYFGLLITLVVVNLFLVVHHGWTLQCYSILAFVPLMLYDGKKGKRLPKYAGYIFYPAHLLAIWLVTLFLH